MTRSSPVSPDGSVGGVTLATQEIAFTVVVSSCRELEDDPPRLPAPLRRPSHPEGAVREVFRFVDPRQIPQVPAQEPLAPDPRPRAGAAARARPAAGIGPDKLYRGRSGQRRRLGPKTCRPIYRLQAQAAMPAQVAEEVARPARMTGGRAGGGPRGRAGPQPGSAGARPAVLDAVRRLKSCPCPL